MFKLSNKIELIVPQEDNNGQEISDKEIKEAITDITKICGGCTITEIKGQWYSDVENRIMQDNNLNLEWYYLSSMEEDFQLDIIYSIYFIVEQLMTHYDQEAVSIKVNGVLYIIDEEDLSFLVNELQELMF